MKTTGKKKWSKEKIISVVSSRKKTGASLSQSDVHEKFPSLYFAAVNHFSSWRGALIASGVNPKLVNKKRVVKFFRKYPQATELEVQNMIEKGRRLRDELLF